MTIMLTRRRFLATASAGAWVALGVRSTAASKMYVSLNSSVARQVPWPEFVRLAGRLGYGGVDVNLPAARSDGVDATRALLTDHKVRPAVVNLPVRIGATDPEFQQELARLPDGAAFAAAIGCERMMVVLPPASPTPKAERRALLKERLTAVAETLRKSNVRLGLEFLGPLYFRTRQPHEFIWRMDETVEFAAECGSNIGVVLDAWHWHHAGATTADILRAGASRIVHVHVSDAKAEAPEAVRDDHRLFPGEGLIDLTGFFGALQKICYEGGVSPEPLGRIPADMPPEESARQALNATKAVMSRAGV